MEEAHSGDEWISDGNFSVATFDIRLPRATLILWIDESRLVCTWRAIGRALKGDDHHRIRGLARVLRFILKFDRVNRPRIEEQIARHGPDVPLRRLQGRELEQFLATF